LMFVKFPEGFRWNILNRKANYGIFRTWPGSIYFFDFIPCKVFNEDLCLLDSSPCGASGFDYPTRHGVGVNDGNAQIPQHVGHCALPRGHPALRQQQR
jgi:hypothetical protein